MRYIEVEELYTWKGLQGLEEMADYLIENGFYDVAKETLNLKLNIEKSLVRAELVHKRLEKVWYMATKVEDCDTVMESLEKEVGKWREL
jgi:hypothetical protein